MTSNEPLSTPSMNATPRPRFLINLTHAVLFLLATAAGAALIYALQPPPPAPGSLLYEITLFTSAKPVEEFTPYFQMLQSNAAQGVRITIGGGVSGNITFSAEPKGLTQFNLTQINQTTAYTTMQRLEFEVRGDPVRDRIRTWMKIGVDGTNATHQFELKDGEYRALEVIRGDYGARQWCYAIVTVQRAKTPPPLILVTPRPAPTDVQEEP